MLNMLNSLTTQKLTTLNIHNLEISRMYEASVLPNVLGISEEYYENGLTRMGDVLLIY